MEQPTRLRVLIASFNAALHGNQGLPLDLVEWLAPTLSSAHNLRSEHAEAPDIVAVGFQELLPLHLGLAGLSSAVLNSRDALIRGQIEQHLSSSPSEKQPYTLVAKHARVGLALLVYAREETIARRVRDVHVRGVGCGWMGMGNKGAIGLRFRVLPEDMDGEGELFTFVTAHLAAHAHNLPRRMRDFQTIVSRLLFPPLSPSRSATPSQLYSTSHLFLFGDLNFRIPIMPGPDVLSTSQGLEKWKEHDQLYKVMSEQRSMHGLHEGEFWKFKPTYKYVIGTEDVLSSKRTPSWTDRVLFATYHPTVSIEPLLYTSIPSFTTSDHKPIVCLLLLPPFTMESRTPLLPTAAPYPADLFTSFWIIIGTTLDRVVGFIWCVLWLGGIGNAGVGALNALVFAGAVMWWFGLFGRAY